MSEAATLQNLLLQHFDDYCDHHLVDTHRRKIVGHLLKCHTEALGGLEYECDHCHEHVPVYHSCRDRHCPQCQQRATRQWTQARERDQLPVSYYHLVFTLPHELNGWIRLHPTELYNLLFSSVWKTLSKFAKKHKKLQGRLGMVAVLHTWGQNLSQHVHLHCLIPAGALTDDQQWHPATSYYLFPVKALSRYFRGAFVSGLRALHKEQQLSRIDANTIKPMLDQLMEHNWVVYAKSTLKRTDTIIRYLARYSHRIAISDYRLQHLTEDQITFDVKEYRTEKHQNLTLKCEEFIRRFLQHILSKGYQRIRHFGFLANACRQKALKIIREAIAATTTEQEVEDEEAILVMICPHCNKGHLIPHHKLMPLHHEQWKLMHPV